MGDMARDSMEGVMGPEQFIEVAHWWHAFPVDIALASTKDINVKLSLESLEIRDFGIVVDFNGKPGDIAEGKLDVARVLGTINGITKGLFMQKR